VLGPRVQFSTGSGILTDLFEHGNDRLLHEESTALPSQGTLKDIVVSSAHSVSIPGRIPWNSNYYYQVAPKTRQSQPISLLLIERTPATYSTTLKYIILTSV